MSNLLARILTRTFPSKAPALQEGGSREPTSSSDSSVQPEYDSQAFALWIERLQALPEPRVFEMGEIDSNTLTFLTANTAGLSVLGIGGENLPQLAAELDSLGKDKHYAGVLCWDLINYLETEQLKLLGEWLAERVVPDGVVMVCLATKVPYPNQPGRYSVLDRDLLFYRPAMFEANRTRRLTSAELSKAWPQFETVRSFLLRNGMQEYVLKRR